jgi:hypothetical protein
VASVNTEYVGASETPEAWLLGPVSPRTPMSQALVPGTQAPVPPVTINPFPLAVVASTEGWLVAGVPVNAL